MTDNAVKMARCHVILQGYERNYVDRIKNPLSFLILVYLFSLCYR